MDKRLQRRPDVGGSVWAGRAVWTWDTTRSTATTTRAPPCSSMSARRCTPFPTAPSCPSSSSAPSYCTPPCCLLCAVPVGSFLFSRLQTTNILTGRVYRQPVCALTLTSGWLCWPRADMRRRASRGGGAQVEVGSVRALGVLALDLNLHPLLALLPLLSSFLHLYQVSGLSIQTVVSQRV